MLSAGLLAFAIVEQVTIIALSHVLVLAIWLIVVVSATMTAMFLGKQARRTRSISRRTAHALC